MTGFVTGIVVVVVLDRAAAAMKNWVLALVAVAEMGQI